MPSQSQKAGSFKTDQMQREMNNSVGEEEQDKKLEKERLKQESQVPPGWYDEDVDNWSKKF